MKRGQITAFLIIAIIVLVAAGLSIYISSQMIERKEIGKATIESIVMSGPVEDFVKTCIKDTAKEGLVFIGQRGGYYDLPELSDDTFQVPYYFYQGRNVMPTKEAVEEGLSEYMDNELFFCLKNFVDFKEIGLDIEQGKINTAATLAKGKVTFHVDFLLTAKKANISRTFESFFVEIDDVRLGTVYAVSKLIIDKQMEDPNSICLSCIIEWAIEKDLMVNMVDITDEDVLFEIRDNNSIIFGKPYVFRFVNRYELSPLTEVEEVEIESIDDQEAKAGYEFTYQAKATGIDVLFSDDTDLFDIHPETGLIKFTPKYDQAGSYLIVVDAIDKFANTDTEMFTLNITSFNNPPVLDYIGYLTASVGEPFVYDVNATDIDGHELHYVADTNLFTITEDDGLIYFIPTAHQKGSYEIDISVADELGAVDVEKMGLIITD